jgi:23S rRNA U2552 (ribose-2'-O)-methylase RlmE/FtsJ
MNFEEKITKKVNMEMNDGLSSFMNFAAQQNHNVYEVFFKFINEIKPKRILEIGTALGGFTQFLKYCSDELSLDINILSYDIHRMSWYEDMINIGIDVRVENIFSENYEDIKNEVKEFIQQDGLTLVLCDGGDKVKEFRVLSKCIKSGDIIMAHDYIDNRENFLSNYKDKIWNWHEISENDIMTASLENDLISYRQNIFDNVVWVCKIKK